LNQKHTLCKWPGVGYLAAMSTVAEIKTAFQRLPERQRWQLAEWIQEKLESFEILDADGARGREPVSAVVSMVRKVKKERREARRRS
jgi:hypothetical protein